MKLKYKHAHMNAAHMYANLSHCKRKKVGCLIIRKDRPISVGYNGTPTGQDNCCEDHNNNTKENVVHAEINAMNKLIAVGETGEGCTMIVTVSPCLACAPHIVKFGITHVVYEEDYRLSSGVEYLREHGVVVECLKTLT